MNAPCTAADTDDWQSAMAALSRVAGRYGDLIAARGGDWAKAASLLWARSRHDRALEEDLARAACALLALGPAGAAANDGEAPAEVRRRRPGKLSHLDRDPEVAAFLCARLERSYLDEAIAQAVARFGPDRVPSRSSVHRYWQRRQRERHPPERPLRPTKAPPHPTISQP